MPEQKGIGELIKIIRKSRGLTQEELGERLEITQQSISHFEKMIDPPKLVTLIKIAAALNCSVSDLLPSSILSANTEES